MGGGAPDAGNLQLVMTNAVTTKAIQVKSNFLFIFASLEPRTAFSMRRFYIILCLVKV